MANSSNKLNNESVNTDLRQSASVVQQPETAGATAANDAVVDDAAVAGEETVETPEQKAKRLAAKQKLDDVKAKVDKAVEDKEKRAKTFSRVIQEVMATENTFISNMKDFHSILEGMLKENITSDQRDFILSLHDLTQSLIESSPLYGIDVNGPNLVNNIVVAMLKTNDHDKMKAYIEKMKLFAMLHGSSKEIFQDSELQSTYDKVRQDKNLHTDDQKKFDSFFIQPVQRGPRFALLLREMVKNSEDDHVHKENFQKIEDDIKKELDKLNEAKREVEKSEEKRRLGISSNTGFNPQEEAIALAFMKLYSAIYTSAATDEEKAKLVNELTDLWLKDEASLIEGFIRIARGLNVDIDRILANKSFEKENPLLNIKWPKNLHPRVAKDESVIHTQNSFAETREKYTALLKQKEKESELGFFSRLNLNRNLGSLTKKMERYQDKISYIKHLSKMQKEFGHYKDTSYLDPNDKTKIRNLSILPTDDTPTTSDMLPYEQKWAIEESQIQSLDNKNQVLLLSYQDAIAGRIAKIRCNDADIAQLEKMLVELESNQQDSTKYGTYQSLHDDITSEIKVLKKARKQNFKELVRKDSQLSEQFQMVLIEVEKKKAEELIASPERHTQLHFATEVGANSPFRELLQGYKDRADFINARLQISKKLGEQLAANKADLAGNIDRFNAVGSRKAAKSVRKARKHHISYLEHQIYKANAAVSYMPDNVARFEAAFLQKAREEWSKRDAKNLADWPLAAQIDSLRELCKIMVDVATTQNSLLGDDAGKHHIDIHAYNQLLDLLNPENPDTGADLEALLKLEVPPANRSDVMLPFHEHLKRFKNDNPKLFAALPREVTDKINALKKTIGANFEVEKSLLRRGITFFFGEKSSHKSDKTKRASVLLDETPPELSDERSESQRRRSRSKTQ